MRTSRRRINPLACSLRKGLHNVCHFRQVKEFLKAAVSRSAGRRGLKSYPRPVCKLLKELVVGRLQLSKRHLCMHAKLHGHPRFNQLLGPSAMQTEVKQVRHFQCQPLQTPLRVHSQHVVTVSFTRQLLRLGGATIPRNTAQAVAFKMLMHRSSKASGGSLRSLMSMPDTEALILRHLSARLWLKETTGPRFVWPFRHCLEFLGGNSVGFVKEPLPLQDAILFGITLFPKGFVKDLDKLGVRSRPPGRRMTQMPPHQGVDARFLELRHGFTAETDRLTPADEDRLGLSARGHGSVSTLTLALLLPSRLHAPPLRPDHPMGKLSGHIRNVPNVSSHFEGAPPKQGGPRRNSSDHVPTCGWKLDL